MVLIRDLGYFWFYLVGCPILILTAILDCGKTMVEQPNLGVHRRRAVENDSCLRIRRLSALTHCTFNNIFHSHWPSSKFPGLLLSKFIPHSSSSAWSDIAQLCKHSSHGFVHIRDNSSGCTLESIHYRTWRCRYHYCVCFKGLLQLCWIVWHLGCVTLVYQYHRSTLVWMVKRLNMLANSLNHKMKCNQCSDDMPWRISAIYSSPYGIFSILIFINLLDCYNLVSWLSSLIFSIGRQFWHCLIYLIGLYHHVN